MRLTIKKKGSSLAAYETNVKLLGVVDSNNKIRRKSLFECIKYAMPEEVLLSRFSKELICIIPFYRVMLYWRV